MKFGPREVALLGLVMAVPLASFFLVFRPQNQRIEQVKTEIDHKRSLLERLRAETARNDDLERANSEITERIADIEARLPSDKEVDDVVRQVSDLAVKSGLQPPVLESDDPVEAALFMEQPLALKTTGEFTGFYRFLQSVEALPRITRIPDMTLTRSKDGDGSMQVEFTLSIYFQDGVETK